MKRGTKNLKMEGQPYVPLSFGHPSCGTSSCEGVGDEGIPQVVNLGKNNPFDEISADLYQIDYKNRIIVIDEKIDERCFVYAKMIENWNRVDKKIYYLKEKFSSLYKRAPMIGPILGLQAANSREEAEALLTNSIEEYPELKQLFELLQEVDIDSTKILKYEFIPIKIKFNSPGGWMLAYETLVDVIKLSKTKVIGINMGMAYSAAAFLLVHCHERLALSNSRMLIHRGSSSSFGSYEENESSQRNYKERMDTMIKSFQERTKVPSSVLKKYMTPDWYLSAKKMLQYGLIDRIVTNIDEII